MQVISLEKDVWKSLAPSVEVMRPSLAPDYNTIMVRVGGKEPRAVRLHDMDYTEIAPGVRVCNGYFGTIEMEA